MPAGAGYIDARCLATLTADQLYISDDRAITIAFVTASASGGYSQTYHHPIARADEIIWASPKSIRTRPVPWIDIGAHARKSIGATPIQAQLSIVVAVLDVNPAGAANSCKNSGPGISASSLKPITIVAKAVNSGGALKITAPATTSLTCDLAVSKADVAGACHVQVVIAHAHAAVRVFFGGRWGRRTYARRCTSSSR